MTSADDSVNNGFVIQKLANIKREQVLLILLCRFYDICSIIKKGEKSWDSYQWKHHQVCASCIYDVLVLEMPFQFHPYSDDSFTRWRRLQRHIVPSMAFYDTINHDIKSRAEQKRIAPQRRSCCGGKGGEMSRASMHDPTRIIHQDRLKSCSTLN